MRKLELCFINANSSEKHAKVILKKIREVYPEAKTSLKEIRRFIEDYGRVGREIWYNPNPDSMGRPLEHSTSGYRNEHDGEFKVVNLNVADKFKINGEI